jgi:hypothetical protein
VEVSVIDNNKFSEGYKAVWNSPHAHVQPTAVYSVNIYQIQDLILRNRQITVRDIAPNSGVSVETVIHEHTLLENMCLAETWVHCFSPEPKQSSWNGVTSNHHPENS